MRSMKDFNSDGVNGDIQRPRRLLLAIWKMYSAKLLHNLKNIITFSTEKFPDRGAFCKSRFAEKMRFQ